MSDAPIDCDVCGHIDFAHADHRGCCFWDCGCERVNYGYGWLTPASPDRGPRLPSKLIGLALELEAEANDWSNDPAAMGAKADAAARIREALDGAR